MAILKNVMEVWNSLKWHMYNIKISDVNRECNFSRIASLILIANRKWRELQWWASEGNFLFPIPSCIVGAMKYFEFICFLHNYNGQLNLICISFLSQSLKTFKGFWVHIAWPHIFHSYPLPWASKTAKLTADTERHSLWVFTFWSWDEHVHNDVE